VFAYTLWHFCVVRTLRWVQKECGSGISMCPRRHRQDRYDPIAHTRAAAWAPKCSYVSVNTPHPHAHTLHRL